MFPFTNLVAGGGFGPPTSGLWARRATRLLYPAIFSMPSKILKDILYNLLLKEIKNRISII